VNSPAESTPQSGLNIGHVLFMDVVGYSKLLNNEQQQAQRELTEAVRKSEQFQAAEAAGKLIRLPTGDGMALVFFNSPDAPVRCAVEISRATKDVPQLPLRMGIHSGPVNEIADVNDRSNVAGAGINIAQRVMDCGDAGHILLSKRVADDLRQDGRWQPQMHDLGECSVKHGVEISVVNLFTEDVGNPALPAKIRASRRKRASRTFRRRILIPGAAILIVALVSLFLLKDRLSRSRGKTASEKSVAVLPLENLSDEKENAYFADGIQDELLSDLAKVKELKVISRTSVIQYKAGIARNLKEIGQQLGVSRLIEGSVRRYGDHVKVSVQLIDAVSARQIWSGSYDRTLADSLALQGELATEIAAEVGATLSPEEKARVGATPTKNEDAYAAYLHGRAFTAAVQSDRSNVANAIRFYEDAVKLDPGFTVAWAFLSIERSGSYWMGFDPTPAQLAAAKDAVDRASALDPNLPETRLARGYYLYYGSRDFSGALGQFQQAQLGLPNNVDCLHAVALIHRRLGHWEEAVTNFRRIVELDPRNLDASKLLATTYLAMRRFPEAIAMADYLLALDPKNGEALGQKISAYWGMGDLESVEALLARPWVDPAEVAFFALMRRNYSKAITQFSKSAADPGFGQKGELFFRLGLAQQRSGNAAAAHAAYQKGADFLQQELEHSAAEAAPSAERHSFLGLAYAGLGDSEVAISEGKKGLSLQASETDPFDGPQREEAMAMIYSLLGDSEHATSILQRLLHINYAGAITAPELRIDPVWDPIRKDSRFQELVSDKT